MQCQMTWLYRVRHQNPNSSWRMQHFFYHWPQHCSSYWWRNAFYVITAKCALASNKRNNTLFPTGMLAFFHKNGSLCTIFKQRFIIRSNTTQNRLIMNSLTHLLPCLFYYYIASIVGLQQFYSSHWSALNRNHYVVYERLKYYNWNGIWRYSDRTS
jgi:hypothetical protein